MENLNFSHALDALKQGNKIQRAGWNGKGMFVYLVPGGDFPSLTEVAKEEFGETATYEPYLAIKNTKGTVNTWVPSVSDLLADDWEVI